MNLIPEWKKAWRMFSVQANVIGAAIISAYSALPEEFKAQVPAKWVLVAAGAAFVAGLAGRLVHQPDIKAPDETPDA